MRERERKFLVKAHYRTLNAVARRLKRAGKKDAIQHIFQGYLLSTKHAEIRIRECYECSTGSHMMALKLGNGFIRREYEFAISPQLFDKLWPYAKKLSKTRLDFGNWVVDFFFDQLYGLTLAEYEQPSGEYVMPPMPDGITKSVDVTDNMFNYANKKLAKMESAEQLSLVESIRKDGYGRA